jgi:ribosomal 50S subunit-recycling heat shock protein
VSVNGKPAKASVSVSIGDIIAISFGQRTVKVEVQCISENSGKDEAPAMYREVN